MGVGGSINCHCQLSPAAGGKGMSSRTMQLLGLPGKWPGRLLCHSPPHTEQKNRTEEGRGGQRGAEEDRVGEHGRGRQRWADQGRGG